MSDVGEISVAPWSSLPDVPGGWSLQRVAVRDREIELVQPAAPDDFLDDPTVLAANHQDDYMPYWSYLWPAATTMADSLRHAGWPAGTEVLEVGCGVGLVGVAALQQCWRVTLSDYDPVSVDCALLNAARNGVASRATGLVLDWRTPGTRQWPVIIGYEVTYEARNHSVLLDLLTALLAPDGVCWFGDPGRSQARNFVSQALDRGFRLRILDAQGNSRGHETRTEFQIMELRKPDWAADSN
ncbi:MAG: class I SAM-dependent methyltransferase [Planctomycetaceae bacterium]